MPSSAEFWSAVEFLGEAGCPTLTPARVSINYEGTRQPDLVTNGRVPRTDDRGSIVSTTVIVTFGRNAKTFDIDRGGGRRGDTKDPQRRYVFAVAGSIGRNSDRDPPRFERD